MVEGRVRTCRSPLTTRGLPRRSKRAWLGSGSGLISGQGRARARTRAMVRPSARASTLAEPLEAHPQLLCATLEEHVGVCKHA